MSDDHFQFSLYATLFSKHEIHIETQSQISNVKAVGSKKIESLRLFIPFLFIKSTTPKCVIFFLYNF